MSSTSKCSNSATYMWLLAAPALTEESGSTNRRALRPIKRQSINSSAASNKTLPCEPDNVH
eukprot:CAMPEP_0204341632 /NCGR_PEP_ID=MMETSP0469-20131031/23509_1 /ASSEMBLY_ACC=CAM_ASM_000384 /TAXON_ID=2969 /ORGANISM="Oxyrrhis marina" /LENGTH=60 /DNA_ID=CAMNT_0051326391 /DNA_START=36 /DNA_END=215 /DNA_ORIENTATION=+